MTWLFGTLASFERHCRRLAAAFVLLGLLSQTAVVEAQILREIEQVIADQSTIIKKYTPPPKRGTVKLNLTDLKGQVLSEAELQQHFLLRSLDLEGAKLLPLSDLTGLWADRLGKETSLEEIFDIAAEIEQAYRRAGYLVIAAVPDQDYQLGKIRIVMFEDSFISTVEFKSNQPELEPRLQPYIDRIVNMLPLRVPEIERILLLMSDLASLDIEATLTRPAVPGEGGTLTVEVDTKRWGGKVRIDNRGDDEVGPLELSGQLEGNDLLRLFEANSLTAVTVPDQPKELTYLQFAQEVPIGTQGFRLGYYLGQIWSEPGGELSEHDVAVDEFFTNIYADYAFLRTFDHSVYGRAEFKTKDNNVDLMGRQLSRDKNRWLSLGLSSSHDIGISTTDLSATFLQGLNIFSAVDTDDLTSSRPDSSAEFSALQATADLQFGVTDRVALTSRLSGQYAFNPLPAATRFNFGGAPFGQAFDSAAISGDSGIALSQEVAIRNIIDLPFVERSLAFVFADFGAVWNRGEDPYDGDNSLGSTGVGLRAGFAEDISAQLVLTIPFKTISDIADPGTRVFFSLGKAF